MISTGFGDVSMTGNIEYPTRYIEYRSGANTMSPNPKKGVILIRRLAEKDLAYSFLLALFTTSSVFSLTRRRTPVIHWN